MFIHVQFYEYEINDHLISFPVLICFLWNVADRIPVMAADGIVINRIERPEDSEGQGKQMFFSSIDVLMRGIISGELWVLTQCFILLLDQWFWHTNLIKFGWGWNPPFSRWIFLIRILARQWVPKWVSPRTWEGWRKRVTSQLLKTVHVLFFLHQAKYFSRRFPSVSFFWSYLVSLVTAWGGSQAQSGAESSDNWAEAVNHLTFISTSQDSKRWISYGIGS